MGILEQSRDDVQKEISILEAMLNNARNALGVVEFAISLSGGTDFYDEQKRLWSTRVAVCNNVLLGAQANLDLLNATIDDPVGVEEAAAVLQLTSVLYSIRREAIESLE